MDSNGTRRPSLAGLIGACRGFSRDSLWILPSREAVLTAFKKNPKNSCQFSVLSWAALTENCEL
jgi:hypothetical protein